MYTAISHWTVGAATAAMATASLAAVSLTMATPAIADVSPQYPPGRYHVVEIVCAPEQPCPTNDYGIWTIMDGGPTVIRMLTSTGAYFDFRRFDTGWSMIRDDTVFYCNGDTSVQVATTSQYTLNDGGGNIIIVDDWTPENPFCNGSPEDTSSQLQFTPA